MINLNKWAGELACITLLSGQRVMGRIKVNLENELSVEYPYEIMVHPESGQAVMGEWQPFSSLDNDETDLSEVGITGITPMATSGQLYDYWMKASEQVQIITPPEQKIIM